MRRRLLLRLERATCLLSNREKYEPRWRSRRKHELDISPQQDIKMNTCMSALPRHPLASATRVHMARPPKAPAVFASLLAGKVQLQTDKSTRFSWIEWSERSRSLFRQMPHGTRGG